MSIILFETSSSTAADALVLEASQGALWGISLGTTTEAAAYSTFVMIKATYHRAMKLSDKAPAGVDLHILDLEPNSFTDAGLIEKAWFLRGKL